jgi:hypothetical protein
MEKFWTSYRRLKIVEEVWFVGACPVSLLSARLASLIITFNEHMAFVYRKLPFISEELVKTIGGAKVGLSKKEIESFVKRDDTRLMFDCAFVKVFESKLDEMFEGSTSATTEVWKHFPSYESS